MFYTTLMTRLTHARKAFLSRDIETTKKTHDTKTIHEQIHHQEHHKKNFNLPEVILGGQDGLVNVLGVILGVAAATNSTDVVLVAGLAATFAESISMGAVAYTATLTEADYYQSEKERETFEIESVPEGEKEEVRALYENYGFEGELLEKVVEKITSNKNTWLKVMMEQELKLEPVERKKALSNAFIVCLSAFVGSFIPLIPFYLFPIRQAIYVALTVSSLSLFAIGYYKARVTLGRNFLRQGLEMLFIGMLSAFAGYIIGSLFKVVV